MEFKIKEVSKKAVEIYLENADGTIYVKATDTKGETWAICSFNDDGSMHLCRGIRSDDIKTEGVGRIAVDV